MVIDTIKYEYSRLRSVENQRCDCPMIALLCVSDSYPKTQNELQYHVIQSSDDSQIIDSSDKILSSGLRFLLSQ